MRDKSYTQAQIFIHISVLLWGFTAILGKLISYDSITLVWQRMSLTALVYLMIPRTWKLLKRIPKTTVLKLLGIGGIVCAHWLTFYGSIKIGNSVSVTLACLGSASFFTSIIEPLIMRKKWAINEITSGIIVIFGVVFISFSLPSDNVESQFYPAAIGLGVLSAALAALFSTLNKRYIEHADPLSISTIEMLSGAILLTIFLGVTNPSALLDLPKLDPSSFDWNHLQNGSLDLLWIVLLAVLCTNLTFYLATIALKQLTAFTTNLTVNLEPVYGIVLGIIIFQENQDLNFQFYLGTAIILGAIFSNIIIKRRLRLKNNLS